MIILNDLLKQALKPPLGLFSVTPLGALLRKRDPLLLFPGKGCPARRPGESPDERKLFAETRGPPQRGRAAGNSRGSAIAGRTLEEASLWQRWGPHQPN